jgi:branched-chain amino acid transport system substrate-binding protein
MRSLRYLLGITLLATSLPPPGFAEPRSIKIDDDLFGPVVVRPDGRAIHNMYILKVKAPSASHGKWDLLEQVGVMTGPEAFRGRALVDQPKGNDPTMSGRGA